MTSQYEKTLRHMDLALPPVLYTFCRQHVMSLFPAWLIALQMKGLLINGHKHSHQPPGYWKGTGLQETPACPLGHR
jgi:hypothetical protein